MFQMKNGVRQNDLALQRKTAGSLTEVNAQSERRWYVRFRIATSIALGMMVPAYSLLGPRSAFADTTWTGATNQDWNTASNWNNGLPGTGNNDAIINTATGNYPILSSGTGTADRDIRIGTGPNGRLDQTGGTLNTGNLSWFFVGYLGSTATYNLANTGASGGTYTGFGQGSGSVNVGGASQNGNLFVGLDNGTVSTLNINTTGTLAAGGLWVGANGSTSSTGTVNLDSGTVNIGGEVQIGSSFFGNGKTGNLNVSGGTLTADILSFARGGDNVAAISGTATITGGTLNSKRYFTLGFAGSASNVATVNNSGGTINVNTVGGGVLEMGVFDATTNVFNQNSGILTLQNNASISFGAGSNHTGTSTFNHNGGTVTFYSDGGSTVGGTGSVNLGEVGFSSSSGTYTYNLNGGTLSAPQIRKASAAATGTFNFNGGTLRPTASNATFMQGLTRANVRDNGAIIDTNGFDVTIAQALQHSNVGGDNATDGGLAKNGSGTLTLTGANTYTGATIVNSGGTLLVNGSHTGGGAYTVNSGGTLGGTGTITAASLGITGTLAPGSSAGTLTFNGDVAFNAASTLAMELLGTNTAIGGGINDLLTGVLNLTLDGTLNVAETTPGSFMSAVAGNKWRLIEYTGTFTDNGLALGTMPALTAGLQFGIETSIANQVNLVVSAIPEASAFFAVGLVGLACGVVSTFRRRRPATT